MPRRRKPPGYEKWTWNEINAGRKMSKAEKRWNRIGKELNWEQRPNGSHQAPAQAVPILVVLGILMFALMIIAPAGLANTSGEAGAIGALVFLGILVMGVLLVLVGHNYPSTGQSSGSTAPTNATQPLPSQINTPPQPSVMLPALKRGWAAIVYGLSFKWVSRLPDWAQPILWGLGMAAPIVLVILAVRALRR